uniref:Chromodomain-helicase-DNA-binding protein 4 (inferred by orthology to a human protein) n=1 Tax=Strongyloides venezuelensis TaxID=75913 RepID=A0A0K0FKC5_STRVS
MSSNDDMMQGDESQDGSQVEMKDDSVIPSDEEEEYGTRKSRTTKSKKSRKNVKTEAVNDVCELHNLINTEIEYSNEDFEEITSYRQFQSRYRDIFEGTNPGAKPHKLTLLITAKYKEFQELQSSFNGVKSGKRGGRDTTSREKSVKEGRSKSARHNDLGDNSDDDFEEYLKAHDRKLDEEEREREEKKAERLRKIAEKKAAVEAAKIKKPKLENIEHNDYCESCKGDGEVLLCDFCPRAYHLSCSDPDLDEPPEGDWMCPGCRDEVELKEKIAKHKQFCYVCKGGEYLLYCSNCPYSVHGYCINPPLKELPGDDFLCPRCTIPEPPNKPDKILSWKYEEIPYPEPWKKSQLPTGNDAESLRKIKELTFLRPSHKMEPQKEKYLFIKWKYQSHWHCEWISDLAMEVHHVMQWRTYWRKTDPDRPPYLDEDEDNDNGDGEERVHRKNKAHDPLELYDRFYEYGIKPCWLVIQRIINHVSYGKNQYDYLVKWSELAYDKSTWERDDFDIPGYDQAIINYWQHRHNMTGEQIPKLIRKKIDAKKAEDGITEDDSKKKKITYDIRKKHEVQPDYISESGCTLHPYQLEGINWLRHCYSQGTHSILADEMGLGKTIQAMSFLYSLYKENACRGPFLVAAPLSTLLNWEREAHTWCKDFYCVTYAGDKDARAIIREHEFSFVEGAVRGGTKATRMKNSNNIKFHVLLTSYELVNIDKAILSSIHWGAVVVDEAHRLKNNQSLFFRNLREYDIGYRLLLTGTPLQNNLEELFHLLNFLCPDSFNDLESFTNAFSDVSKEDQIQKLHSMLGPHMLRRVKADVLTGMPSKTELIVPVDLAPMQRKYYRNILTRNFEALSIKGASSISLINILMELKKCCNHPFLFSKASLEAPKTANGMYELNSLVKACGKLVVMQKMLRKLFEQGNRVLIFSQMTRMLDILEDFCEAEGYKYERIDGSITGQIRQEAIDRFNAPGAKQFIFLLSTRAGGLGINLATADTVIIYDSDWNPHNDTQAFSRAHRLGQKNTVLVYRFVTRNSVEERVTSVAKKKMLLNHLVVRANSANKGPSLSKTELDDVLRWGTEELFKDDENNEENGEGKPSENAIVWDDEAIDKLLERKPFDPNEKVEDKKDWSDEYLSTFKVATYATKEVEEEEEDEEVEREVIKQEGREADPDYWEKLLRHHYEQDQESELQKLGKGKRIRKQVNYATNTVTQDWQNNAQDNDDDYSESFSDDTGDSDEGDSDSAANELKRRRNYADDVLPPLVGKVNGQIEILGFNPRQRKAFYQSIMRWGMPPNDAYQSQWLVPDLKSKSERAYKVYAALFLRHLCEDASTKSEFFSDGVPREGLNKQHILSRIGMMGLIRKKINEFESLNGEWSIPEIKEAMDKAAKLGMEANSQSQSRDMTPSEAVPQQKVGENEVNECPVDETKIAEDAMEVTIPETVEIKESDKEVKAIEDCMFNINDGGFTELHTLWKKEEETASNGKKYEVWHRRHDYWLLLGICIHGYAYYKDIFEDPRFAILKKPFEYFEEVNNVSISYQDKIKFMQRRHKLLEQALIIEEQLRRVNFISNQIEVSIAKKAENMKKQDNGDDNTASAPENVPADFKIDKESELKNRVLMTKVIGQLEDLVTDLKSDTARVPTTLDHLTNVLKKINLPEKDLLRRLSVKDDTALSNQSCILPPAPFFTSELKEKITGVQPKFAIFIASDYESKENILTSTINSNDDIKEEVKEIQMNESSENSIDDNCTSMSNVEDNNVVDMEIDSAPVLVQEGVSKATIKKEEKTSMSS